MVKVSDECKFQFKSFPLVGKFCSVTRSSGVCVMNGITVSSGWDHQAAGSAAW